MKKYFSLSLIVFVALMAIVVIPNHASATAVTVVTATTTSSNASTTLAKVGNTVQFGINVSGTPLIAPQINIFGMGSTTFSGSGAWWNYSTTSVSVWTAGAITFSIGIGGTAGDATTTVSQTSLTGTNVVFDQTAPSGFSATMGTYVNDADDAATSFTFSGATKYDTYLAYLGNGTASSSAISGTISTATDVITGIDISALDDGTLALDVALTDAAGNKSATTTVSAISILDTTAPSTPTASPDAGSYTSTQSVVLYSSGSNSIRYTIEGTTQTCSTGSPFSGSVSMPGSRTIKAVGCDTAGNSSAVSSFAYVIQSSSSSSGSGPSRMVTHPVTPATPTLPNVPANPLPNISAIIHASPNAVFMRMLNLGSNGEDVKNLQKFLNSNGFTVAMTGFGSVGQETTTFGPATRAAVIKFQLANGVIQTATDDGAGLVGPKTRAKINALGAGVTPAGAPSSSADRQTLINSLQAQIIQLRARLQQLQSAQ